MAESLVENMWIHAWQIGVLAVLVAVVAAMVGRRRPHLAYALWLVVLAKCFVPPLWGWSADVPGWHPPNLAGFTAASPAVPPTAVDASTDLKRTADSQATNAANARNAPTARNSVNGRTTDWLPSPAAVLVSIWALGVAVLVGGVAGRASERRRVLRRTASPAPEHVELAVARAAVAIRLNRLVQVSTTSTNFGPGVIGTRRPVIVVPAHLVESLTPEQLETMLAHELAHVRRGDAWVARLQLVAQIVWWFHPLVWWMNRRLVRERERCCDEEVVAGMDGNRRHYARCLVNVLEAKLSLEPLWGHPGVRPAELTRHRLEEIMKRPNMTHRRAPYWCAVIALGLALAVLPSGQPRLVAQTDDDSTATNDDARSADRGRPVRVLKYGDNKADGKKSIAGAGEMIRFTLPEGVNAVRALRVHCARYGYPQPPKEDVEITFLNEDMTESLHTELVPYSLFKRTKENRWTMVPLDELVELPKTFWVVLNFNAERTKGVYVSYDASTKGKHSRVGFNDEDAKETEFKGDWMVQALLPRR